MKNKIVRETSVRETLERGTKLPFNLQFFAKEDDGNKSDDDGTDIDADIKVDKTENEEKTDDSSSKAGSKTFTQDQVKRMMTKEKNQGRAAVLRELGINPGDTKAINTVKKLLDSLKTDEEKESEKNQKTTQEIQEAQQKALQAEAKAEAMMLDAKPEFVDDIVILALAKMNDDSDLKTIIGEIKTKFASFFKDGEDKDDKSNVGKKGTGSSIKGMNKDKDPKELSLGARLAAQRNSQQVKKSNFKRSK